MSKIGVGIVGYGNLGRGVELALNQQPDMQLTALFTRRDPQSIKVSSNVPVESMDKLLSYKDKIDVMILCGGSATDLPKQTPDIARLFNTVDSFDTHAKIPEHFKAVDESAKSGKHCSIISVGWDPGLFSMMRILFDAVLPKGHTTTFWGRGVSQGHSDAIRRVKGVKNGVQYTIPSEKAIAEVRAGKGSSLTTFDKHTRECYVVAETGADRATIEKNIKGMPDYFLDYHTIVHFITEEELKKNHGTLPHGGFVFRTGASGDVQPSQHVLEFSLKLDSNPEFTASVLTAAARAVVRMNREGTIGAKTILDVPLSYMSSQDFSSLLKNV